MNAHYEEKLPDIRHSIVLSIHVDVQVVFSRKAKNLHSLGMGWLICHLSARAVA